MTTVGVFFAGPMLHQWYTNLLPKLVGNIINPTKI